MMKDREWLADQFEACRPYLRSVAYRMLGSVTEADDAVQESWLRLDRSDAGGIDDLRSWLTTVVGRICLDLLRGRRARGDVYLEHPPEPIETDSSGRDPENEAIMADSVGLALLVVLETLSPAERIAFVLHDVFNVGFEEIAQIVDRSPTATRQLASRARRRVQDATPSPETNHGVQRSLVNAFLAASRSGDFEALLEVLDPGVVLRVTAGVGAPVTTVSGARDVANRVLARGLPLAPLAHHVMVNGAPGVVVGPADDPISVVGFKVSKGRIIEIGVTFDPAKFAELERTLGGGSAL